MPLILPGNVGSATAATEIVSNSARFNAGSSDYLSKAFGTGNRKTWTFSTWIKLGGVGDADNYRIFSSYTDNTTSFYIGFDHNRYYIYGESGNTVFAEYIGTSELRDPSAWYHLVYAFDTTQGTAANRFKIYRNNVLETLTVDHAVGQNEELELNRDGKTHYIGQQGSSGAYFSGYLAETVFIDGAALAPTSFGEFDSDSGIWKPIDVSGLTFGTNGFYLDYEDSSALGNDKAGSNNFAVSNLTAIDQSTDTCVNNFATLNPLNVPTSSAPTFSEGNLKSISGNSKFGGSSTIGLTSGKWFLEAKSIEDSTIRNTIGISGEVSELARLNKSPTDGSASNSSIAYQAEGGNKYVNGSISSYGATYGNNDIIGIAIDLDSGTKTVTFYKNGASQGAITIPTAIGSTTDGAYFIIHGSGGASPSTFEFNFGSPPYAISSGNTDGDGYGNFEYAVPSGYFSLNTKNLAEYG